MRAEALRNRGLLHLSAEDVENISTNFFQHITINENTIVAGYWPKGRELDVRHLMDDIIAKGATCALPVVEEGTRQMKFAFWNESTTLTTGKYEVCHPEINENTKWLEPDIFLVPLLAFDRRGMRLGFGGGYYDTTLAHYRKIKDITAVGIAYAEQACLFNLPSEEHDQALDWVITPQAAHSY
ncbi:MAG: 5-formyltetrahydrofolate cyclo-ligase [Alphaproteobacteria bacterium]|nr:5-formyltetrahydrofolate cyclo-ligase [Alphaproteobacteria bacterium]